MADLHRKSSSDIPSSSQPPVCHCLLPSLCPSFLSVGFVLGQAVSPRSDRILSLKIFTSIPRRGSHQSCLARMPNPEPSQELGTLYSASLVCCRGKVEPWTKSSISLKTELQISKPKDELRSQKRKVCRKGQNNTWPPHQGSTAEPSKQDLAVRWLET